MDAVEVRGTFVLDGSGAALIHLTKWADQEQLSSSTDVPRHHEPQFVASKPPTSEFFRAVKAGTVVTHPTRRNMTARQYYVLVNNIQHKHSMTNFGLEGGWSKDAWESLLQTNAKAKTGRASKAVPDVIEDGLAGVPDAPGQQAIDNGNQRVEDLGHGDSNQNDSKEHMGSEDPAGDDVIMGKNGNNEDTLENGGVGNDGDWCAENSGSESDSSPACHLPARLSLSTWDCGPRTWRDMYLSALEMIEWGKKGKYGQLRGFDLDQYLGEGTEGEGVLSLQGPLETPLLTLTKDFLRIQAIPVHPTRVEVLVAGAADGEKFDCCA
ncbi:unnamed protein product [Symbiodinium pilosum]|uniref:Uncharacterized protein n=1 Tax=Symbiodinium pilosum TaxID=2952 RepID=A0A812RQQ7_SYMPI|nr:unnamed protein product [Symbiodinium pilosum]